MTGNFVSSPWSLSHFSADQEDEDYALALQLHEDASQSNVSPQINEPVNICDPSWELIDPTPDILQLFLQFNQTYFEGKLDCVEVKWSPRMTSCAGVCRYEGRGGLCSIGLSLPLLKLRPRSDLVNTLLHEMIHAVLFVTNNNKDHDSHGAEFHKHMYRINKESGSNITVYHTFHDEVKLYQTHWWKCDGPCSKRHPFYGIVRRSMNRAPGPSDRWWPAHQKTCGGVYKKIKEPDKDEKKQGKGGEKSNAGINNSKDVLGKVKTKTKGKVSSNGSTKDETSDKDRKIDSFFSSKTSTTSKVNSFQDTQDNSSGPQVFSGSSSTSSSNIHGFKMTARKDSDDTSLTSNAFSGKGVKISAQSSKNTKPIMASSLGARESFLKKLEDDIQKEKGEKRKTDSDAQRHIGVDGFENKKQKPCSNAKVENSDENVLYKKIKDTDKDEKMKQGKGGEKNNAGINNTKDVLGKVKTKTNWKVSSDGKTKDESSEKNRKIDSFLSSKTSNASKVNTFQDTQDNCSGPQVFSGSSSTSSSNIHGFKMTARKDSDDTSLTISDVFSGKGIKISSQSSKNTKPVASSSVGARESFLRKLENGIQKGNGEKRKTDSDLQSHIAAEALGNKKLKSCSNGQVENSDENLVSSKSKISKDVISINDSLEDVFSYTDKSYLTDREKTTTSSSDFGNILVNDSADDELLSAIDESILSPDKKLIDCPACPAKVLERELNKHLDMCLA